MQINYEESPYFYFLVDNFYTSEEFSYIYKKSFELVDETTRNHCRQTNHRRVFDLIWEDIAWGKVIHPFETLTQTVCSEKNPKLLEKINSPTYGPAAQMQFIPRGWDYNKPHTDIPSKIFTFTVYISENGKGTQVFSGPNMEDHVKTTDWQQNSGMGFIRTYDSWHNFGALEDHDRVSITYFYREVKEYRETKGYSYT